MFTLSTRNQMGIGLALVLLMIITRGHHFASLHNLPDASWLIFFLAGVYLRSAWPLLGFLALGGWLDFAAYTWGGVSGFCLTPAYVFLLPAYISLWLAGRWYAHRHQFSWLTLMPLSLSMMIGLMLCELFSGGGFYFFSGRFESTTWVEFAERSIKYFPMYIESFLIYAGIAIVMHAALVALRQQFNSSNTSAG
ncbi:hypothetical protein [Nitrosomonas communis]|uniref:Cobalamin ABC transporter n=1 Tax=Nitrosomonas communis TaxID=44574 RepID=A0A1H2X0M4_9PROT|nr:hypothetical protein [Nitrosomonas communis]SDW86443.1 hypothetical protein SAMN05421882_103324 [Nitrosomonas communis]